MVEQAVIAELGKLVVKKLGDVDAKQVAQAVSAVRRATSGMVLLPVLGVFGVGVAVGVGAGLLFAPRTGRDTRAQLRQRLRRLSSHLPRALRRVHAEEVSAS